MDKKGYNKASMETINLQLALLFMLSGIFTRIIVRQNKSLNNIAEQDDRFVNKIKKSIKGFKVSHSAETTLADIKLHHIFRKG